MALALAVAGLPGGAAAAPAAATCPDTPTLPSDLQGWSGTGASATMRDPQPGAAATVPALGDRRTKLTLHKGDEVAYRPSPTRSASAEKWGGIVPITVAKAGRLIVAIDAGAWIDLVQDGMVVVSAGHGHGPACSGIRKMVEFDVVPGRYLLQIIDAPQPSIHAMAILREGSGGR